MAFIAPLAGAAVGGGLLGSIVTTAVGVGINLAIAYFFPQKIKGPRAESLKAQTSRYGEQLTRGYYSYRTAGAVIWLKGDHVDEHVRTERQGKALGPEVTTYSYTATFAVAFAWNGPCAAVPRIWADDKLIFDVSAEALQDAITNGTKAIGVAKGATIRVYLGTDTQDSDPDIEADRGVGQVPAWPGIIYVVIKNLPLDEFGIRVPNIEAEILNSSTPATLSIDGFSTNANQWNNDTNGDYLAANDSGQLIISRLPAGTEILNAAIAYPGSVHVSDRIDVAVVGGSGDAIGFYDAATGAFRQEIVGLGGLSATTALLDDVSFGGVTYMLVWVFGSKLNLLSNIGTGWNAVWNASTVHSPLSYLQTLSVGPDYAYALRGGIAGLSKTVNLIRWDVAGLLSDTDVTLSALSGNAIACFYDDESDSVIVLDVNGNLYVYTPDLGTLLRSNTSTGVGSMANAADAALSKRMKSGSDLIAIKSFIGNDVREFRVSDLSLVNTYDAATSTWLLKTNSDLGLYAVNETWQALVILPTGGSDPVVWYLPRAQRQPGPVADVLEAECRLAGLIADASQVTAQMYGYADRAGTPPRGLIEDITRVNFIDFAQVDGVQTFFPRKTTSTRTIPLEETGMALNAEPEPQLVSEEYPDPKDLPEQVIITYPSYDAVYRIGAQAGTTDDDEKFSDEPSQADETGAPIKVRRNRTMEFSTSQILKDDDAAKVADVLFNSLRDAASSYKTTVGPKHLDLYPGEVVDLALDETRTAKAVVTKMTGDTVIEMEFRKRGDSFTSQAVGSPTPYVIDSLLGPAEVTPVLIDGHLLRGADDNDGFYAGVAVIGPGSFRSASIYRSEDGGGTYAPWAGLTNGMIRGIARDALPNRAHPGAIDRATSFTIAVAAGSPPDSVSEDALLASDTSNGFAVWNPTLSEWEYIRAASVVDNGDGTWTLSTLLRGLKGTEFAMAGHAVGAVVYHLDDQAMTRPAEGDRTLPRLYVAVATSTAFDSTGAVTFTNQGKGLRCWAPTDLRVARDASGNISGTFFRRDRIGQEWPEDGPEDPPMSEASESYIVSVYDGSWALVREMAPISTGAFSYSAADQTTDFGSVQSNINFGIVQVSATYGDGIELRQAA